MLDGWVISCEITVRWMSPDLTNDKLTLVQVMAWCLQSTSHYLSQCWHSSMSQHGVTRSQWVLVISGWQTDKKSLAEPMVTKFTDVYIHHQGPLLLKPRSHCADLEVPISTTWKIVENGMVGSGSRGNIVLTSWKSARSENDRQWSGSQYDKVLL